MNFLLVGKSIVIAKKIHEKGLENSIIVVDEINELKSKIMPQDIQNKNYTEVSYIKKNSYSDIFEMLKETKIDAVIPSFENTVELANYLAKKFDLPRLGDTGSEIFRNKNSLRKFSEDLPIQQPSYEIIKSENQLNDFFDKNHPIIIKPTKLAGSIGVLKVNSRKQLKSKFDLCINSIKKEQQDTDIIAESFISGNEYSCEYVVQNGKVIFRNITKKFKFSNEYFVESGHLTPAIVNDELKEHVYKMMDILVNKASIGTGVLHAEWLVTKDNNPFLVECAGRRPGDRIVDLLSQTYNDDFLWKYCLLLTGKPIQFNNLVRKFSLQLYFDPKPGRVKEVINIDEIEPFQHQLLVSNGDIVQKFSDSTKRVGYVILNDFDFFNLQIKKERIFNKFKIITE